MITTGSRWLATQPETPEPNGSRILPTSLSNGGVAPVSVSDRSAVVEHVHEADVGGRGRGDHPGRRRGERLDAGTAGRGLDQLAQQRQLAVGVDEVADRVRAATGLRSWPHW